MTFSKIAALSLAGLFTALAGAQTQQSLTVLTAKGFETVTFDRCYKLTEVDRDLKRDFNQDKINIEGKLSRRNAALYADPVSGSYTITVEIPDEARLIRVDNEHELKRTGQIREYMFSCVIGAGNSGYPDKAKETKIYKDIFGPK